MSQQQSAAAAANDIQERIAAARREAESLKEKIRAKKETSADTSCKPQILVTHALASTTIPFLAHSARNGS